jgi:formamidopyrimidine-DNA glycosylase
VPELPDVEGFKRYYARHAAGRRVESVAVPARSIVRNTSPQALGRALRGVTLQRPERRGKWMLAPAGDHLVLFHFGMTGFFAWTSRPADETRHRHDRLIIAVGGGELRYRNMRMLGGVWLARDRRDAERIVGPLGPDAAVLSRQDLDAVVAPARGGLKGLLMNQRRVAGIGNELSDEILWRARFHPRRPAAGPGRSTPGSGAACTGRFAT